jgi:drug/metabolite transporter (DMT)-like permease
MSKPQTVDAVALAAMVVLCASWGFQQVAVKVALAEVPPIAQAAIRSVGAALLVGAYAAAMRRDLRIDDGTFWPGVLCGAIFGAEFLCLFLGLRLTEASRAVMFLYTAPFVVAIGARFLPVPEALTVDRWIGVAVAFAGLVVLLGPNLALSGATLLGDLLALAAGILWGVTTLIVKGTRLRTAEPAKVLLYQLVVSAVLLVAASPIAGENLVVPRRWETWSAMLYQTVWVTTVTYLIWFALVRRYPPARLSVLSFLAPVFGVMFGHWALGEPLTGSLVAALVLVAGGIVLVNRPARA